MKIKQLEIVGFKSFVERTVLHFGHDVVTVVGPNGCGKSNVVDAVRWVMGEQSPQRLRGKAMEDVIFNGSESRGPHGFAEVTITFDNRDGLAPPEYADYAEIGVTRRLDREGHSEYFINKTHVRLLDVTNLFLGTGVGRRAYSIVEQGQIGVIVSSRPEERRYLIDEAAGVTRFKARKRAAERKMEQTRQNLLRVGDILAELEKSLASLHRQALKAERYKQYRAELKDLDLWSAAHRWLELTAMHRVVALDLERSDACAQGSRLGLKIRETELETERLAVAATEADVERAQNRAYELENVVRWTEGTISQQRERLSGLKESEKLAARELDELRGQRVVLELEREVIMETLQAAEAVEATEGTALAEAGEEFERRRKAVEESEHSVSASRSRLSETEARVVRAEAILTGFERRRGEASGRMAKLEAEKASLASHQEELGLTRIELEERFRFLKEEDDTAKLRESKLEEALKTLRNQTQEGELRVESLREELTGSRARLRSLEEVRARFDGVGGGVRALLTQFGADENQAQKHRPISLLADHVECPPEMTRALTAALGERLRYVIMDDLEGALDALRYLTNAKAGRATLMPRIPRRVVGHPSRLPSVAGVRALLIDLIETSEESEWLVRHLIGDVLVVEDLETGVRLHTDALWTGVLVTLEGEVIRPDGTMSGGVGDEDESHLLEMRREIRTLHDSLTSLESGLTHAVELHAEVRKETVERQSELDVVRRENHARALAVLAVEKDLLRAVADFNTSLQRSTAVSEELDEIKRALVDADEEEAEIRTELDAARGLQVTSMDELRAAELVHQERRILAGEQYRLVHAVEVRAAEARQRAESERGTVLRLHRSIEELDAREQRLGQDVLQGARQQGESIAQIWLAREELVSAVRDARLAQDELSSLRVHYEEKRQALGQDEAEVKHLRSEVESLNSQVSDLVLREREYAMKLQHLLEQVSDRYRLDVRRVLGDFHLRATPDESAKSRVEELERTIERMGEINLTAIEEHREKSQRYEFLHGQRSDLEEAITQLERAIRQMNMESRRRFKETFEAVNERFKKIFPQMFGGGKAELALTNPDDLLETGVEIIAQPPGKKLGALELMSGGEKALTAVSLIFALFQYKPSPFCLLDEVDAPLDEANVGRFTEAIRQMTDRSQFILITHSKRTMESADVLYGVTMEEPGVSKLVSVTLRGKRSQEIVPQAAVA